MNNKKILLQHHLEHSVGFRSFVPEPAIKAKYNFYYTTACHIVSARY